MAEHVSDGIHSTGRGGRGNIGTDPNVYADGAIVREGVVGETNDNKEYSTGRGGAGNIGTPKGTPQLGAQRHSEDVIPETALRSDGHENFHAGRGGKGNEIRGEHVPHKHAEHPRKENFVDKAKNALGLGKKDKTPEPSAH
ncbi:hypothetical protein M501DRAFT_1019762 [Patellaria atrata CBS 101060]|uniref:Uncharacterized protein n=1 Tax=Patellaria atrata CBS 101060 TaxID=1346257 RepID=A0A9P4VPH1_9PEZI|nr:hypothetical protein M501DRAFT_1019762 [Patellaria atrata CBS 101060]